MFQAVFSALISLFSEIAPDSPTWNPAQYLERPTPASNPLFTPEEPRTLVLALIGVGVVVAFAGVSRWLRAERKVESVSERPVITRRAA